MSELDKRLRTIVVPAGPAPDLEGIRRRGRSLSQRRQMRRTAAVCVAAATAAVVFVGLRPSDDVVETAGDPAASTIAEAASQPDPTSPVDDREPVDADWSTRVEAAEAAVSDGAGGFLVLESETFVHLKSDGSSTSIPLEMPVATTVRHTLTDIAPLDGVPHALINRFVDRQDLPLEVITDFEPILRADAASIPELVASYNDRHGAEFELGDDSPDAQQLRAMLIEQWMETFPPDLEYSILAIDLNTDEVITVEERVVDTTLSPEWFTNEHITTDGANIVVMRGLWASTCHYAEGLTLDGRPVGLVESAAYRRPTGLEALSAREIQTLQETRAIDCHRSPESTGVGLAELGRVSTDESFDSFATAFASAFGSDGR